METYDLFFTDEPEEGELTKPVQILERGVTPAVVLGWHMLVTETEYDSLVGKAGVFKFSEIDAKLTRAGAPSNLFNHRMCEKDGDNINVWKAGEKTPTVIEPTLAVEP